MTTIAILMLLIEEGAEGDKGSYVVPVVAGVAAVLLFLKLRPGGK